MTAFYEFLTAVKKYYLTGIFGYLVERTKNTIPLKGDIVVYFCPRPDPLPPKNLEIIFWLLWSKFVRWLKFRLEQLTLRAVSAVQIFGVDKVLRTIANLPKQVRFATAQAINQTAKDVQTWTLNDALPDQFTLRSKGAPWQRPGTRFGFNIRPFATRDNLTATLGSQADWLRLQETGGTKTIAGHRVPIPTLTLKPHAAVTQRQQKPSALLRYFNRGRNTPRGRARVTATPHPFLYQGSRMRPGIYIRQDDVPRMLYAFKPSVPIRDAFRWEKRASEEVNKRFGRNFQSALVRALATAR